MGDAMKNKQLKDLCEQAGMECSLGHWYIEDKHLERFAELVRQDEREINAKLCDGWGHDYVEGNYAAKTIRAKGNHGQD